jgi:hypothetical protein
MVMKVRPVDPAVAEFGDDLERDVESAFAEQRQDVRSLMWLLYLI